MRGAGGRTGRTGRREVTEVTTGQGARFGQVVLTFASAALLAFLMLGATLGTAGAWESTGGVTMTKEEFVNLCKKEGGTVTEAGGSVRCDWPATGNSPKYHTICTWAPSVPRCTDYFPFYSGGLTPTTHVEVGGGVAVDDGEAPGGQGPVVATRGTANPGGVLVLDDEQP
jgi:hypothetical protein